MLPVKPFFILWPFLWTAAFCMLSAQDSAWLTEAANRLASEDMQVRRQAYEDLKESLGSLSAADEKWLVGRLTPMARAERPRLFEIFDSRELAVRVLGLLKEPEAILVLVEMVDFTHPAMLAPKREFGWVNGYPAAQGLVDAGLPAAWAILLHVCQADPEQLTDLKVSLYSRILRSIYGDPAAIEIMSRLAESCTSNTNLNRLIQQIE